MTARKTFSFDKNRDRFTKIGWTELVARFAPKLHKPFKKAQDQLTDIVVFSGVRGGTVRIDGDLVIDCTRPNVVIDGDLVVAGNLEMDADEGFGNFVIVTGDVVADAVCLSGFPELVIGGDLTCAHGVIGMRGDDGGYLDVVGNTKAPVIVADTYFNFKLKGKALGVTINTSGRSWKARYDEETMREVVLPKYLEGDVDEEDGEVMLDSEAVFEALRAHETILKGTTAPRRR